MAKDKKKILDNDTNTVQNKIKKSHSVTSNKNYESLNIVSETGDSIYSPHYEEFTTLDDKGQIFISQSAIEEIVNRIIDHRLGNSINNSKENGCQ
ncbi:MAG: hypothetical protein ACRD6U_10960 [Nitrososphaeraceae archaeon]